MDLQDILTDLEMIALENEYAQQAGVDKTMQEGDSSIY
jgi:hypothetical protein